MSRVRIATVQFEHRPVRSFDEFAAQVQNHVRFAADCGAELIVFPEYVTGPLAGIDPDWHRWTPDFLALMEGLSRENRMVILGGTHLVQDGGKRYNRAHLFLPDGRLFHQDKVHLTPCEVNPWDLGRGNDLLVVDTPVGRLAVNICFDVEFPGAAQAVADAGADLLLVPSATDDRQGFWRVRYCCHARAVENQIYVVHSGVVGALPQLRYFEQWYGRSAIITPCDIPFPPDGIMVQGEWNQDCCLVGEVDLGLLQRIREAGSVLPRTERRPEAYRTRI
jgi:predicted amidohydrolase